jgi:ribosome-binding protein aMBF1 (putative translation factor)
MTMHKRKRKALEAAGWKVGNTQDFLGLSDAEVTLIDVKLALARAVKAKRLRKRMSQADVAVRVRSSQSRVAKMESGDATVSIDLLVRTLLALGASRRELARMLTG